MSDENGFELFSLCTSNLPDGGFEFASRNEQLMTDSVSRQDPATYLTEKPAPRSDGVVLQYLVDGNPISRTFLVSGDSTVVHCRLRDPTS